VLSRFWALAAVGIALLAGRGFERLVARRAPLVVGGVGVVVVAVLVAELYVRPGFDEVDVGRELEAVNRVLDDLGPGVVTELPVPAGEERPYVFAVRQLRSLEDGRPRVEGYSGDAPDGLDEYLAQTSTFPAPSAFDALRRAGVRHVVLHGDVAPCAGRYGAAELRSILAGAATWPGVASVRPVGTSAVVTLTPSAAGTVEGASPAAAVERTTSPCPRN
jgi:hypothetical protein